MSGHTKGPVIKYPHATTDVIDRAEALISTPIDKRLRVPSDVILRDAVAEIRALREMRADLLEAAKDLLEHVDRQAIAHLAALKDLRDAVRKADAAIAKAEAR